MKKIEFRIRVNQEGNPESDAWNEEYQKVVEIVVTAQSLAEEIIKNFNSTLKQGESERTLLSTQVIRTKFQCPECFGFYDQEELNVFGGICEDCT